jgi:hypothetical protein
MKYSPSAVGQVMRKDPRAPISPLATASAASRSSMMRRPRSASSRPAAVSETCRVVRWSKVPPVRCSSCAIARLTCDVERRSLRAAAAKVPFSAMATSSSSPVQSDMALSQQGNKALRKCALCAHHAMM